MSVSAVATWLVVLIDTGDGHGERFAAGGCRAIFFLDPFVDLSPEHRSVFREGESELYGLAADIYDGDFDIVVNDDGFADFPR